MAVLSTLQNYADSLLEQLNLVQSAPIMEQIRTYKWSIFGGTVAAYALYKYLSRPRNLPPGPVGWPVIGALTEISMDIHNDCIRMSKKYKSDIISFYIGQQLNVILNSADSIRAGFAKTDDFSHRDPGFKDDMDLHEVMFSESFSEEWKKLKTFMMTSLKTNGFGTAKSEDNMKLQLTRMIAHLETQPDNTIDSEEMKNLLNKATACIIMKIMTNQNYEFDDPELLDLISRLRHFMDVAFRSAFLLMFLVNMFPKLFMWMIKWKFVWEFRSALRHLREFYQVHFEDHRETLDVNNSRDFMDDILIMNSKTNAWTDLQMVDTILIFNPDAIDTTTNQIAWALFYVCWNPEVQEEILKEIKSVCGDNMPAFKDRNYLNYCEAVMLESLRMSSIASLSGPHMNIRDVNLNGYNIPKNTMVQANMYAVHYDEKLFPEPNKFKPERFLSSDGKLINSENVMAFGTGRRKCIGEPLTKCQVFYYVAGLVQNFQLSFVEKPDSTLTDNMFRAPPKHKMKFTPRY